MTDKKYKDYLKSLTILYVEDDDDTREQFSEFLRRLVGVLITAINGSAGFDAYREHRPDIIITDIQMPVMDGLTMLSNIRSIDKTIPAIVLTAYEQVVYLKRTLNLGAQKYITKPVDVLDFTETLYNCAELLQNRNRLVSDKERAEAALKATANLFSTATQELIAPMNSVISLSDLLLDTTLTAGQREYARLLQKNSGHLLELVNDIFDYSKIKAGTLETEQNDCNLRSTIENAVRMYASQASDSRVKLACHIDPAVPYSLQGDSVRIRQIVTNLVGNAVKFTHEGLIETFATPAPDEGNHATILFELRITDISSSDHRLEDIFSPFTRTDSDVSGISGGVGLGLALCRNLVELMGGQTGVGSTDGKVFSLWFTARFVVDTQDPASLQSSHDLALPQNSICNIDEIPSFHEARILVAEDSEINWMIAQQMLYTLGYRSDVVIDGREAVAALERIDYDLVLMDCMMPGVDGYTATSIIRDPHSNVLNHNVPIIAMTANALKGDREKCIDAGMDDYLAKPVKMNKLADIIDKWLEVKESTIW